MTTNHLNSVDRPLKPGEMRVTKLYARSGEILAIRTEIHGDGYDTSSRVQPRLFPAADPPVD